MIFWTVAITITGGIIFLYITVSDDAARHGILLGLYLILATIHIRFLFLVYNYFLYITIITDRKVHRIKKTLFSIDDHQSMDIGTLQDVLKQQHGLIQNMLGFGSLILEAQDSELRLHFVPRISNIHHRLSQIRERAREKGMGKLKTVL